MTLPNKMRAVEIVKPGGPDALVPGERALPTPKPNEVLIKVAAAGVNRPDVLQRQGLYAVPPDASDLPGLEIAGEVVACGAKVTRWKPGDKVCALAADADARAQLGANARAFARATYDLKTICLPRQLAWVKALAGG